MQHFALASNVTCVFQLNKYLERSQVSTITHPCTDHYINMDTSKSFWHTAPNWFHHYRIFSISPVFLLFIFLNSSGTHLLTRVSSPYKKNYPRSSVTTCTHRKQYVNPFETSLLNSVQFFCVLTHEKNCWANETANNFLLTFLLLSDKIKSWCSVLWLSRSICSTLQKIRAIILINFTTRVKVERWIGCKFPNWPK